MRSTPNTNGSGDLTPKRQPGQRMLLTAEEVAAMTGMGVDWIYAQARLGRIPTVKLGRYRRFRPEAIDDWLRSSESEGSRR